MRKGKFLLESYKPWFTVVTLDKKCPNTGFSWSVLSSICSEHRNLQYLVRILEYACQNKFCVCTPFQAVKWYVKLRA